MRLLDSAAFLLLAVGSLIGASFPLGKLAAQAGIHPVLWSLVISGAAGLILTGWMLGNRQFERLDAQLLRFSLLAGMISYALPNLVMFTVIPILGAGFVGLMFTLSPIVTLLLSLAFGLRRPSPLAIAGILVGFFGAVVLTASKGIDGPAGQLPALAGALALPLLLATGNIYRTIAWPAGRQPLQLAATSNLGAAVFLIVLSLVPGLGQVLGIRLESGLAPLANAPVLTVLQIASACIVFALFFRLQQVGGPVYLSQIGYVAAAVGLVSGMIFLGERHAALTWIGAAIIAAGIALSVRAQIAQDRNAGTKAA